MAFRFRLDPVLRYRKRLEDERSVALAEASRRSEALAQLLDTLRARAATAREELAAAGVSGSSGGELRQIAEAIAAFHRRAVVVASELTAARAKLEAARARLVATSRDRRVLERLAETQLDRHRRGAEARSQAELDDVAARYSVRQRAADR
jgi:flagellar export protein FliJ